MKYNCIKPYYQHDLCIMEEGDIVVLEGIKLYNITKKIDTNYICNIEEAKQCLEVFTDESYSTESVIKTDTDKFEDITKIMIDTFTKKNHDYGNSFDDSCNKFGFVASVVRMNDKINRINTLYNHSEIAKVNEKIEDTLLDLANYCIMSVMWLKEHKI